MDPASSYYRNALSDWIRIAEEITSRRLIDQPNALAVPTVLRSNFAAVEYRNPRRGEVIWPNHVPVRVLRSGGGGFASFDRYVRVGVSSPE